MTQSTIALTLGNITVRQLNGLFSLNDLHPRIDFIGARANLATPIVHRVFADMSMLFAKLNRYSDLAAQDLADRAGVGVATVRRCEAETGFVSATQANKSAMRSALEAAGVVFIEENGGGAGVRLSQPNSHND